MQRARHGGEALQGGHAAGAQPELGATNAPGSQVAAPHSGGADQGHGAQRQRRRPGDRARGDSHGGSGRPGAARSYTWGRPRYAGPPTSPSYMPSSSAPPPGAGAAAGAGTGTSFAGSAAAAAPAATDPAAPWRSPAIVGSSTTTAPPAAASAYPAAAGAGAAMRSAPSCSDCAGADNAGPGSGAGAAPAPVAVQRQRRGLPGSAASLTAALSRSPNVFTLLDLAEACEPLNSLHLCALLTRARRLADRRGGASGRAPHPQGAGAAMGSDGGVPTCTLPAAQAARLAELVARHSEVLADADPPEMAGALWSAAVLRLPLPAGTLGPTLEATWLWEPADWETNLRQASSSGAPPAPDAAAGQRLPVWLRYDDGRQQQQQEQEQLLPGGGATGDEGDPDAVMGLSEFCLIMSAVSVLEPAYLRDHAGGMLEVLDSYQDQLTAKQLIGAVQALARVGARVDEVGQELLLSACFNHIRGLSPPQLAALLGVARSWPPLAQEPRLRAALLRRLLQYAVRPLPDLSDSSSEHGGAAYGSGRVLAVLLDACIVARPSASGSNSSGSGGSVVVSFRALSKVLRVISQRAHTLNTLDCCAALRTLGRVAKQERPRVVAWKQGVPALVRRWAALLRPYSAASWGAGGAAAGGAGGGIAMDGGAAGTGHGGDDEVQLQGEARSLATALHAIAGLRMQLRSREAAAALRAAAALAPAMCTVDCAMALHALAKKVTTPPPSPLVRRRRLRMRWRQRPPLSAGAASAGALGRGDDGGDGRAHSLRPAVAWPRAFPPCLSSAHPKLRRTAQGSRTRNAQLARRFAADTLRVGQLLLQRSGECLLRQQAGASAGPPELTSLLRSASLLRLDPGADWMRQWQAEVGARLAGPGTPRGRAVSRSEAAEMLFSLARFSISARDGAQAAAVATITAAALAAQARAHAPHAAEQTEQHNCVPPAPAAAGQHAAAPAPAGAAACVERSLLRQLLALACWPAGGTNPGAAAASGSGGWGRAAGSQRQQAPQPLRPLSVYGLMCGICELGLGPDHAVWGPLMVRSIPQVLPLLVPRRQVRLMASLCTACRAGGLGPPPPAVATWLQSFRAALPRAKMATLATGAALTAQLGLMPPPVWLRSLEDRVLEQAAFATQEDVSTLVHALERMGWAPRPDVAQALHDALGRRAPSHQRNQRQRQGPGQGQRCKGWKTGSWGVRRVWRGRWRPAAPGASAAC